MSTKNQVDTYTLALTLQNRMILRELRTLTMKLDSVPDLLQRFGLRFPGEPVSLSAGNTKNLW